MIRAALFAALLALCSSAFAEDWLVATLTSYHFDDGHHNQRNYGLGVEHTLDEHWSLLAGEYRNSMYRTSVYAGAAFKPWRLGDFGFGFAGGAISGYLHHPIPMLVPTTSFERGSLGANLFFAPHVKDAPGVLGLQLKARF